MKRTELGHVPSLELDSMDYLTEPIPCSLICYPEGHQMEVSRGQVYPQQTVLHTVPILDGYAAVKVEFVHLKLEDYMFGGPSC